MARFKIKMKPVRRVFNGRFIPALLLILISCVVFWLGLMKIDDIINSACYVMLKDYAVQIEAEISGNLSRNMERLEAYAEILGNYDSLEGEDAKAYIEAYRKHSTLSELGVLLPDDRMLLAGSRSWESGLKFEEEAGYAPRLSKQQDPYTRQSFISQSMLIRKNGSVTGVLYEFTYAKAVVSGIDSFSYPSNTELCIIDGETGDYVTASSGNNIFTDESRKPDSPEELKDNFKARKPGYAVLRNQKSKTVMHAYYIPSEIDGWMIMLAFSQEALFDLATKTRKVMNNILAVEIVLFLTHLCWLLFQNHRHNSLRERQIFQMEGLIYIQEELFDAHKTPGRVESALGKTADMLAAKSTFLIPTENDPGGGLYVWPDTTDTSELDWQLMKSTLPHVTEQLYAGYSVLTGAKKSYNPGTLHEVKELRLRKLKSLILVPIFDAEQKLIRVLGSANVRHSQDNVDLLEAVAHTFMMALENIHSYHIIEKMGTTDALTGLLNRNCFQRALKEKKGVCGCVYMDANGLHDINNEKGHAAGDAMLSAVAAAMRAEFGPDCTYRIGGDEFVALIPALGKAVIEEKINRIDEAVKAKGYHVSSGYSCGEADTQEAKNALVTEAELLMYENKRKYYASLGNGSGPRNLPESRK